MKTTGHFEINCPLVCTLCITTDIRIITVYKDNSSQIKSSKTAAFAKPANREKLIGGGARYVGAGLAAALLGWGRPGGGGGTIRGTVCLVF